MDFRDAAEQESQRLLAQGKATSICVSTGLSGAGELKTAAMVDLMCVLSGLAALAGVFVVGAVRKPTSPMMVVAYGVMLACGCSLFLYYNRLRRWLMRRKFVKRSDTLSALRGSDIRLVRIENPATQQQVKLVPEDTALLVLDPARRCILMEGYAYRYLIRGEDVVALRAHSSSSTAGVILDYRIGERVLSLSIYAPGLGPIGHLRVAYAAESSAKSLEGVFKQALGLPAAMDCASPPYAAGSKEVHTKKPEPTHPYAWCVFPVVAITLIVAVTDTTVRGGQKEAQDFVRRVLPNARVVPDHDGRSYVAVVHHLIRTAPDEVALLAMAFARERRMNAVRDLAYRVEDPNERVRSIALTTLEDLTGERLGASVRAWSDYGRNPSRKLVGLKIGRRAIKYGAPLFMLFYCVTLAIIFKARKNPVGGLFPILVPPLFIAVGCMWFSVGFRSESCTLDGAKIEYIWTHGVVDGLADGQADDRFIFVLMGVYLLGGGALWAIDRFIAKLRKKPGASSVA